MIYKEFIINALNEDLGDGDHSSLASIPAEAKGKAKLLVKENGILAGIEVAKQVFHIVDPQLSTEIFIKDGSEIEKGQIVFTVTGSVHSILKAERLVLNCMQRMSGVATATNKLVKMVSPYGCKILDTRKTTPGMRALEKEAVKIGGGVNHRFGLYDMIMLKDNHIDYAGGIEKAINSTLDYLKKTNKKLKIEVETRSIEDVEKILSVGNIDRIMLDNFSPAEMKKAVSLINKQFETEASGGITEHNITDYAATGVDFISVGAITHSVKSLDLSLKAY